MRLIDADEYIEKLRDRIGIEPTWNLSGLRIAIFELHNMPTIDPVKHGRWSREHLPSTSGGSYEVWRCSECQSAFNWRMRYCGHCGARMDEVTE